MSGVVGLGGALGERAATCTIADDVATRHTARGVAQGVARPLTTWVRVRVRV